MTAPTPDPVTKVLQLSITQMEGAQLTLFAAIGASIVNEAVARRAGDLMAAARCRETLAGLVPYAVRGFEDGAFTWARWSDLNRKMAKLSAAAGVDVVWRGDRLPGESLRPGEKAP